MSEIDVILLGLLKNEPQSAYDLQKNVNYRNISYWVKISTPSIYRNIKKLEEKRCIKGKAVKNRNMPEKIIYEITQEGDRYFQESLLLLSQKPVNIFLSLNAVILNLDYLAPEQQRHCMENMETQIRILREHIQKVQAERRSIPMKGQMIIQQQLQLARMLEAWLMEYRKLCEEEMGL